MTHRILVVDDDRTRCDLVEALLGDEGYEVRCARDGLAALAEVEREPPDLVVTDVQMPRLDGLGLLAALAERGLAVPVVVMSARHLGPLPSGPAFLAKPFDAADLLRVVGETLAPGGPRLVAEGVA